MTRAWRAGACFVVLCTAASLQADEEPTATEQLLAQSNALRPLVESSVANAFLDAVPALPLPDARVVYLNANTRDAKSADELAELSDDERAGYEKTLLDANTYYFTRYGSPLAFVRPVDLLGTHGLASLSKTKWVDFGFGSIGQLRLLATQGAHAVGIEVDPLLRVMYGDAADTGRMPPLIPDGPAGEISLVFGQFPGDADVLKAVGGDVSVFISKNTLKRGYIHPAEEVDPRMLVHLGVEDRAFVTAVHELLVPGGWFVIYNLCPPQSEERYVPWADGRCPFDRDLCESVGFDVIAYDADDTAFARRMGQALGWAAQMNLDTDLFGIYTILRKP